MGFQITELRPIFTSFYALAILTAYLLFYPHLHQGRRKLLYGDLLVFAYLVPAVLYIRTFIDVLLPVIFVTHVSTLVPAVRRTLLALQMNWRSFLDGVRERRALRFLRKKTSEPVSEGASARGFSLKPILGLLFALLIGIGVKANVDQLQKIRETAELLSVIPERSIILSSFNQQYTILFVRPDLKIIPSSEAGLPAKAIREAYVAFFKEGAMRELAQRTGAAFLIEGKDIYLDPGEGRGLAPVAGNGRMRVWRILPAAEGETGSIEDQNGLKMPDRS